MVLEKQISESEYFHAKNAVLPSLLALRFYLRTISISEFESHVTKEKNDFANWVEQVFGEKELAKQLRSCLSREQMVWILDDAFSESRMQKIMDDKPASLLSLGSISGQPDAADPAKLEDDQQFLLAKPELVARNEAIGQKYETVAKQMQEALLNPVPKNIEELTEKLKTRYAELMVKISETRRSGKDCLIPALVLRQFLPKLSLAKATRELKDFEIAKIILEEADFELRQVIEQKELNVKAEVLALAGIK